MRITRTHAAAFIGAIALALAAPGLAAQQPSTPPNGQSGSPSPPPTVERPEEPEQVFRSYGPTIRIGQDYTLRANEVVRDVRSVFGDVTIDGRVDRDVVVVLGSARLGPAAIVDGSLVVIGGGATIAQGAAVRGDMVVVGGTLNAPSDFSPGGEHVVIGFPVLGNALRGIVPWITRGLLWGRLIVPELRWIWIVVGTVFLIALLVNTLFDRAVRGCADTLVARPLSSFLLGLLVAVLCVPALAILAATVIGLAVVPFVLCAIVLAGIVGKVGVARAIGRGVIKPASAEEGVQAFLCFVLGFAVLVFVYMVPLLGVVTWALTGVLGLGAAASTFRAGLRREQPARVVPPVVVPVVAAEAAVAGEPAPAAPVSAAFEPVVPVPAAPPAGDLALYPRAAFLDRLAAFALDCVLVAIAVQLLVFRNEDGWFPLLLLVYHIAFWTWKGTTLGGIICAVRVIRTDGTELRPIDAVVRGLSAIFSIAALGIGCFWMLQDAERQMWHDKIAGTLVVKVPRHMAVP
jgi:uncharacterized RDD family membrane protein YckC